MKFVSETYGTLTLHELEEVIKKDFDNWGLSEALSIILKNMSIGDLKEILIYGNRRLADRVAKEYTECFLSSTGDITFKDDGEYATDYVEDIVREIVFYKL